MYAGSQWFVASKAFVQYVVPAAAVGWGDALRAANPTVVRDSKRVTFANKYLI